MASSSEDIEADPFASVSNLRSRFEALLQTPSPRPSIANGHPPAAAGTAEVMRSPRPRIVSGAHSSGSDGGGAAIQVQDQNLRLSSSASELRRKPPPPPPSRGGARGATPSPAVSPLLRPVPAPYANADVPALPPRQTPESPRRRALTPSPHPSLESLVSRKPPPPPPQPAAPSGEPDLPIAPAGGVAALKSRYGSPSAFPPLLSPQPVPAIPPRSHAPPLVHTISCPPLPPRPRHSPDSSPDDTTPGITPRPSPPSIQLSPVGPEYASAPPPIPPRLTKALDPIITHSFTTSPPSISDPPSREPSPAPGRLPRSPAPPPPPRPSPGRRPPPRHQATLASPITGSKPPLPVRQASVFSEDAVVAGTDPPFPPRIPARHAITAAVEIRQNGVASITPLIKGALPPPPTRIIAAGAPLPEYKRPPSEESEESEEDEDGKAGGNTGKNADLLPDATRASRRPPIVRLHPARPHVTTNGSLAIAAGATIVCAHGHDVSVYDLTLSDAPMWQLDLLEMGLREWRGKGVHLSALEWRGARAEADQGCIVWFGTKEGHLLEVDVRTGSLLGRRPSVHVGAVTHIFRHGRAMVTLDDAGKALVFTPDGDDDVQLAVTHPRVVRVAERHEFAQMFGGCLWTSARSKEDAAGAGAGGGAGAGAGGGARGPLVRVYDVFTSGSAGQVVLPREHLGTVACGTVLPCRPNVVFLGHEGGTISVWDVADGQLPQCVDVVKVSVSDVLGLQGVGARLWAAGRNGWIVAYDVEPRPWVVTNAWVAHADVSIARLDVDPYSVARLGRLCVVSVGRDDKLRIWDGLLSADWIEQEALKREAEFSSFRGLSVLIFSWNLDAAKPEALQTSAENATVLEDAVRGAGCPDVVVFGFQEMIDLESRKMAAKTVVFGSKRRQRAVDGGISEKVTTRYKLWFEKLSAVVRAAGGAYTVVNTENLVGLFSCVFVKTELMGSLTDAQIKVLKRGMGGRYGNKGCIMTRMVIDDTSLCFVNCHLAAGQGHTRQRNADLAAIVEEKYVFPERVTDHEVLAYVNGGDGSMVLDHEVVFISGDLNYRIDQRRDAVVAAVHAGEFSYLWAHDQLLKEMKFNRGFRMKPFREAPLAFAPTYKYDRRSHAYDTSEKRRVPAWCDRVLWRARVDARVECVHYGRYEADVSDHRPISALFVVQAKRVDAAARAQVQAELESLWRAREQELLGEAHEWFVSQAILG